MCHAGASGTASSPCRCQRQEQWSRDREEARGPGTLGEVEGRRGAIMQGLRASRRMATFMLSEMVERLGSEVRCDLT